MIGKMTPERRPVLAHLEATRDDGFHVPDLAALERLAERLG